jgi:hypothetical protein
MYLLIRHLYALNDSKDYKADAEEGWLKHIAWYDLSPRNYPIKESI